MTDVEFHTQLIALFDGLNDGHMKYEYPAFQRCYTTAAPFSFSLVDPASHSPNNADGDELMTDVEIVPDHNEPWFDFDELLGSDEPLPEIDDIELPDVLDDSVLNSRYTYSSEPYVAVRTVTKTPDVLALFSPEETAMLKKVQPGDVLVRYNGKTFKEYVDLNGGCGGASPAGKLAACATFLTYRRGAYHHLHQTVEDEFVLRRGRSEYVIKVPIVALLDENCINSAQQPAAPPAAPRAATPPVLDQRTESDLFWDEVLFGTSTDYFTTFYGQPKLGYDLHNTAEPTISWSILLQYNVGILRLDSFHPLSLNNDVAGDLIRRLLVNELKDTRALIIDVRGNVGGSLYLAELILQLFTHHRIQLAQYRALISETNGRIFNNHPDFQGSRWQEVYSGAQEGDIYTQPAPLSNEKHMDTYGQAYLKPVAVFTNAECYSACELFTARFQDHEIGRVFGEDSSTGGGGANVVDVNHLLSSWLPEVFQPLPGGQNMAVSWRQHVRSGPNEGKLIEDVGVFPDQMVRPSPRDFSMDNADYTPLHTIASFLADLSVRSGSSLVSFISEPLEMRITANSPITFKGTQTGLHRLELYFDDALVTFTTLPTPAPNTLLAPTSFTLKAPTRFTIHHLRSLGFFEFTIKGYTPNGKQVLRTKRYARIVPHASDYLKIEKDGPIWVWDFGMSHYDSKGAGAQNKFVGIYNYRTNREDGWQRSMNVDVSPNSQDETTTALTLGNGIRYKNNVQSEVVFFFNIEKGTNALLHVKGSYRMFPRGDSFTIQVRKVLENHDSGEEMVSVQPDVVKMFGSGAGAGGEGEIDEYLYLGLFEGERVEVSLAFRSDAFGTDRGVTIADVEML
ncbi:hypothetical protein HK102_003920 [Quaeritorhiza haematococci]|nr:hypothetical protein HK102_003920 [Quaeritorhiza haematococci]